MSCAPSGMWIRHSSGGVKHRRAENGTPRDIRHQRIPKREDHSVTPTRFLSSRAESVDPRKKTTIQ